MIPSSTLFLDLETLPGDATVGMDLTAAPAGWEPTTVEVQPKPEPTSYSGEKLQAWRAREIQRQMLAMADGLDKQREAAWKHWRGGSMRPVDGRIACIGWALGEGPPAVIDCAETEGVGLLSLLQLIRDAKPSRIVAHNGAGFDFPWVQLRAGHHRIMGLPHLFWQDKPWETRMWDTLVKWPGTWSKGKGLDDCARLLGISREGNPISGGQVLDRYVEDRWTDVVDHCLDDIGVLREVYRWELEVVHG